MRLSFRTSGLRERVAYSRVAFTAAVPEADPSVNVTTTELVPGTKPRIVAVYAQFPLFSGSSAMVMLPAPVRAVAVLSTRPFRNEPAGNVQAKVFVPAIEKPIA